MKFDKNNPRYSHLGFLLVELDLIKDYIEKVFKPGLRLIENDYQNIKSEDETLVNYTYAVNEQLRYNMIKSSFLFMFSNYESSLHFIIKKLTSILEGKNYPTNRDVITKQLNIITNLLDVRYLKYRNELSTLQKLRNIITHRNGKLLPNEFDLKVRLEKLQTNHNIKFAEIDEITHNLKIEEDIIFVTYKLIDGFYRNIICLYQHRIDH